MSKEFVGLEKIFGRIIRAERPFQWLEVGEGRGIFHERIMAV